MIVGNQKINPNACTDAEQRQNWANTEQRLESAETTIITNAFIVKVSANDTTADYLYPSMTTTATRDTNADPLIAVAIANAGNNETLDLFLDASIITNGGSIGTGVWALVVENGSVKWYDSSVWGGGGGGADVFVKVTVADASGEYLSAKMEDYTGASPAYGAGDMLVKCDLTNSGAAENLRYYINSSAYPNYSSTGTWALSLVNDVFTWVDISAGASLTEGYLIDIVGDTVAFDPTEVDGWADGELLGKSGGILTLGDLSLDLSASGGGIADVVINFDGTQIAHDSALVDSYKLKVSSTDTTTDYLYPKLADQSSYSSTAHQLVYAQVVAGQQVRLFTDRADTAAENTVELITFIYRSSIAAANGISGPAILPTELTVETMSMNTSTGRLEPAGSTTLVEYREGKSLAAPPTGHVYMGEALRIGSNNPVVLVVYCKQWAENGSN